MALAGYPKTFHYPEVELMTAVNDIVNLRGDISKISYIKTHGKTSTDWVELWIGMHNSNKTGLRTETKAASGTGWTEGTPDTFQMQSVPTGELVDDDSVVISCTENTGSYNDGIFTIASSEIASVTTGGLITVGGSFTNTGFDNTSAIWSISYNTLVRVRLTVGEQLYGPFDYVQWHDEGATGQGTGQSDIYISVFKTEH